MIGEKKIIIVVGTRPNYIKVTQFKKVAEQFFPNIFNIKLVHTGQHFDKAMADDFFEQLDISPDFFLNITPGSPTHQIGEILISLEKILHEFDPDWVMVVGDVNSTVAAAICANKSGYKLAHLESGLRSFDRTMPEEINRVITDEISDLFFVTEESGVENLLKEGKSKESIHFVGNTMIDTMVGFENDITGNDICQRLSVVEKEYALLTIHRPATADNIDELEKLCSLLQELTAKIKIVFPIHPRTKKNLMSFGFWEKLLTNSNISFTQPLDYFSFQKLILSCRFVLTDSGGIQEETTYRKIPCLTLRPNTERPVTVQLGSNTLIPFENNILLKQVERILNENYKQGSIPKLWDGQASKRILEIFNSI